MTDNDKPLEEEPVIAHAIQQLALYQNMRDAQESGTVLFDQLDHAGQESYLKDAHAIVMAMILLGWRHPDMKESS